MMTFDEYLKSKKIDPQRYRVAEKVQYQQFEQVFLQMHPGSFTAQKLYLINNIRRRFPAKEEAKAITNKPQARPKVVPRPKKSSS